MKKFMLVCLLLVSLLAVFSAKAATDTAPSQCSQALHNFSLGKQNVEGTIVDFTNFDGQSNGLYAFNLDKWNCINEKTNQAVIRLYDAGKNLLAEEKSLCIDTKHIQHFGSISLNKLNRQNIGKVKYFSLVAIPCSKEKEEKEKMLYLKDNPKLRPLFENSKIIVEILASCIDKDKLSELECNCKDKLKIPVGNAVSFLEKHPELKGKTLSLFEQKKAGESLSMSVMLDGIVDLQNKLKSCK